MKVKFGEFLKDLRKNEGLALFHPAWLSVDRYVYKDDIMKSYKY
jgi:hypothetical protein